MLDLIAKDDSIWRRNALAICKDKTIADDLVNDMYIRLHRLNPPTEKLTHSYINRTLINMYKLSVRTYKNEITLVDLDKESYRISDEQVEDVFCDKDISLLERANNLEDQDKKMLIDVYDNPIRKVAESIGVHYTKVNRNLEKARREVLGDDYDTEYNNRRCKYKKIG